MKIRKGDTVKVISGKNRGKTGVVLKVGKSQKILVEGVNLVTRHLKAGQMETGGIVKVNRPIHASNVMIVCPKCNKPARVGYKLVDGRKYRICKKCKGVIQAKKKSKVKSKKQ